MDVSAIVLNKLLTTQDIEIWAKLKLVFLDSAYSTLYTVINRHYEKYHEIPSFDALEVTLREGPAAMMLATLKLSDVPDVSAEVALDALMDQFTQNEAIKQLDKFVDKLPLYDTDEIKENLSAIAVSIEEKTFTSEKVFTMENIMVFQHHEEITKDRVYLGLNNNFDAVLGGVARGELILIGGERGSGKSLTSSNVFVNQYESGMTSVYFTIEMIARETHQRNMAILANVDFKRLNKGESTDTEVLSLVKARAGMFVDANETVLEFMQHRDKFKFEETLVRNFKLKPDNQMIIIDDRELTIGAIDLHVSKLKAKFGDKLGVVVVDYINQIVLEGSDQYDWKPQIEVSKKLKNLARKHEVVMVSPYQIDQSGEARFAKGLLDAADIALTMKAHEKSENALTFDTTKIRSGPKIKFTSPINWETLRISPQSIEQPEAKEDKKKAKKKSQSTEPQESPSDLPWNS